MYLCYLDESGTPQIPGNTSHFILAGISIPSFHWKDCDRDIFSLKKNWELADYEIHTAWMLRPYLEQRKIPDFEKLDYAKRRSAVLKYRKKELYRLQKNKPKTYRRVKKIYRKTEPYVHLTHDERRLIIIKFSEIIGNWGFARLFAECIDKTHFDFNLTQQSVEEQAFEQVVSRFERYLQNISKQRGAGLLIHDNNPTLSKRLTDLMIVFHRKGTLWTKIKSIIETPLFVDSKLTCMVQVADLCSYSLRRYFENSEDELLTNIFIRADRKGKRIVGIRHFTDENCICMICSSNR